MYQAALQIPHMRCLGSGERTRESHVVKYAWYSFSGANYMFTGILPRKPRTRHSQYSPVVGVWSLWQLICVRPLVYARSQRLRTLASDVFVFGFFRGNIHPDWIPRFGTSLQKMQWSCQGRRHEERWHNRWGTWWINMICHLCFQAYDFIPMVLARISTAPRSTLHSPHAAPEPFVRMTFIRVSQSGQIWALQCRPDKFWKTT